MNHKLLIAIFIIFSLISTLGIFVFFTYYNRYQRRLKQTHPDEYRKLELKDSLVATAGDWIRWPLGSAGPMLAIFNIKNNYNDDVLSSNQNRALIWLFIFLISIIGSAVSGSNL
jgi:hypothetical protein